MDNSGRDIRGLEDKGFFAALFDFSFTHFVTIKLIPVLYIIAMIGILFFALGFASRGFADGGVPALLGIVGGILFAFFGLLYARVILETLILLFRIESNTASLAHGGGARPGPPAPPPPMSPPTS